MAGITEVRTKKVKNSLSQSHRDENQKTVKEDDTGDHGKEGEPEPEKNVDLFIEKVRWQKAQSIVLFHIPRNSVLVVGALGHSRKNNHHWVDPIILVHFREADYIEAIGEKGTAEKSVSQIHLSDDVEEVEHFAKDKAKEVQIVVSANELSREKSMSKRS